MGLFSPWYLHRPSQVLRRCLNHFHPATEAKVTLPWGVTLSVNPAETIGQSILRTGVFEIAVSEVLFRAASAGSVLVDAGANIGYMTSVLAAGAGNGTIHAYEPHPVLFSRLENNAEAIRRVFPAWIVCNRKALSRSEGLGQLCVPEHFGSNAGVASLEQHGDPERARTFAVETITLDSEFRDNPIDVLKLDVEGHEQAVLGGATGLLSQGKIRLIVFEDFIGEGSPVFQFLARYGYSIYGLGYRLSGPQLLALDDRRLRSGREAPNYLAAQDPALMHSLVASRGWRILRARI